MMTFLQSLILGIVQGLTEYLPISSSAHLVLVPYLFNWSFPAAQIFPFDVLVQLGTLLAVILYFWKDLVSILKAFFKGLIDKEPFKDPQARLGWYLILATIPAALVGMLIKAQVEAAFSSPRLVAYFLFGTATLLILSDLVGKRTRQVEEMTWWDALWIGLFQAISVFPGISRSGATITGGMTHNFDRSNSARFSFLMSIPVMIGAGLVSILAGPGSWFCRCHDCRLSFDPLAAFVYQASKTLVLRRVLHSSGQHSSAYQQHSNGSSTGISNTDSGCKHSRD
jgi:undecaprenyl-diphosphatase